MSDLILDSLSKTFPSGTRAIHPFSLTIVTGEIFVLLGPSGSGKTTLLRLIAGLEVPDSGDIRLGSQSIRDWPPHERGMTLVSQNSALYPHRNVLENLAFGLRLQQTNLPRKQRLSESLVQQRAQAAAEKLRITHLCHRYPQELSGGEQRRVALGRALASGQPIWLMDEPLSQLDLWLKYEICRELHLLQNDLHTTILYITHDPIEAMTLATRIGVLGSGHLLQVGNPIEVYHQPSHVTVAHCLGWPPMNFIDAKSEPLPGSVFCFRAPEKTIGAIRSDRVRIRPAANTDQALGHVVQIQPFGPQWLVTVQAKQTIWYGLWQETDLPTIGTQVSADVPDADWLWFDQQGQRSREVN